MLQTVEFHVAVADPVHHALRLVRKAVRADQQAPQRMILTAPAAQLQALDTLLWEADADEFLPHWRVGQQPGYESLARHSPIWLAPSVRHVDAEPTVLVNVGAASPTQPHLLARLIELVSLNADEAAAGRERWRHYKALGFEPQVVFDGNRA